MMNQRRGFLATIAAAVGAMFAPKAAAGPEEERYLTGWSVGPRDMTRRAYRLQPNGDWLEFDWFEVKEGDEVIVFGSKDHKLWSCDRTKIGKVFQGAATDGSPGYTLRAYKDLLHPSPLTEFSEPKDAPA